MKLKTILLVIFVLCLVLVISFFSGIFVDREFHKKAILKAAQECRDYCKDDCEVWVGSVAYTKEQAYKNHLFVSIACPKDSTKFYVEGEKQ